MRTSPLPVLRPEHGYVVSYCPTASAMGNRVLREGGNAIDAAVATALALAVTYPQAGNLGGGGFALVHRADGTAHFLDFRETAPAAIRQRQLIADQSTDPARTGALAGGVPGTVAGLGAALERFGTWTWEQVSTPAVELAEHGYWLTTRQAAYMDLHKEALSRYATTRRSFTRDGQVYLPGQLFKQLELASTLRSLIAEGPRSFYTGRVAGQLLATIRKEGGVMTEADLTGYHAKWREPLRIDFCGRQVVTAGFPSGGGMILAISLALLEGSGALKRPAGSFDRLNQYGRAFRVAFALMREHAGDPDYLDANDLQQFNALMQRVRERPDLDALEAEVLRGKERPERLVGTSTTHFSVLDREGNAVSMTYSLNTLFGSKLMVEGGGYLLNNTIDDFLIAPNSPNWYDLVPGERNVLYPGHRPVSSMSPTVVQRGAVAELVVGGSGGPRIPTMMTQIIAGTVHDGLSLEQAIQRPRVHQQYVPDELAIEDAMPEAVMKELGAHWARTCRVPQLGIGVGIHRRPPDDKLTLSLDARFSFG